MDVLDVDTPLKKDDHQTSHDSMTETGEEPGSYGSVWPVMLDDEGASENEAAAIIIPRNAATMSRLVWRTSRYHWCAIDALRAQYDDP